MNELRRLFRLEDDIVFLNHGSFGATPRAVMRAANKFRKQMEAQPVRFLGREIPARLAQARDRLAEYVGADSDNLAFVPNATYGVNVVAHSLAATLRPGDEVLTTDHEYGACSNAWEAVCARTGAKYVRRPVPMPDELVLQHPGADPAEALLESFWAGVNERTAVIFISHISSPTAVYFPVEQIVARARERGIVTFVDGAHTPGQIPLRLEELGADFYTGNLHKWLCAPKGTGLLHVRSDRRALIRPLVVSWGCGPERQFDTGNDFWDGMMWAGTDDFSSRLAVPAAITFQQEHDWDEVRAGCSALLDEWLPRLAAVVEMPPVYAGAPALRPPQLGVTPIPVEVDVKLLKQRLWDEFRIELPAIVWRGRHFLRVSVQGYNDADDLAALESAVGQLLASGVQVKA